MLFVPDGVNGIVDLNSGSVSLRNILVPVAMDPSPARAICFAERVTNAFGASAANIHALHLGTQATLPTMPHLPTAKVDVIVEPQTGNIVQAILETSRRIEADLIVMPTHGHHGFLDALRGSTTEQVLRNACCPVLAVTSGRSGSTNFA